MRKYLILFFLFILAKSEIFAQHKKTVLTVSGGLSNESGSKLKDFTVTISDNKTGEVLEEFAYSNSSNFSFQLPMGADYIVVFQKKGYLKKQILINTETKHKFWKNPHYEFDALMPRKIHKNMGPQLINKPVVRLYYNERKKEFDYDQLYTSKIDAELSKVSAKEKEVIVKKLERQVEADSLKYIASISPTKTNPIVSSEEKKTASEIKTESPKIESPKTESPKTNPVKENKAQQTLMANVPVTTKTESLQIKNEQRTTEIQKKELEVLLNLNRDFKIEDEVNDFKTYAEIINSRFTRIEYNYVREKEITKKNKLNESIKAKYETSNPLTSLLDNIDEYEKTQRMKAFQKR